MPDEHVGVVVVLYNSSALLADLVMSLDLGLRGVRYSVIFVDNSSTDCSADRARALVPEAQVVRVTQNSGYAAGINTGVRSLADDVTAVLVLNPDVRLGADCVAELVQGLRAPATGIAVPRLSGDAGQLTMSLRREPLLHRLLLETLLGAKRLGRWWDIGEFVFEPKNYQFEHVTDWAEGSTQLISRECLATVGPWDESYFMFSEETDFGLRARDAGFRTRFVPTARATHLEGSRDSPPRAAMLWRNKIVLYRRRHGVILGAAFYLAVVLHLVSRAVRGTRTSRQSLRLVLNLKKMLSQPGPNWLEGEAPRSGTVHTAHSPQALDG